MPDNLGPTALHPKGERRSNSVHGSLRPSPQPSPRRGSNLPLPQRSLRKVTFLQNSRTSTTSSALLDVSTGESSKNSFLIRGLSSQSDSNCLPNSRGHHHAPGCRQHRPVQKLSHPAPAEWVRFTWRRTNGCAADLSNSVRRCDQKRVGCCASSGRHASASTIPTSSLFMKSTNCDCTSSALIHRRSDTAAACARPDHPRNARHCHPGSHRTGGRTLGRHHPSRHQA